jgi:hypothetical protein
MINIEEKIPVRNVLISTPGIIFSTNSWEEDYLKLRTFFLQEMTSLSKNCGRVMQREGEGGRKGSKKRENRGLITPHPNLYFKLLISMKIFVVNFKTFNDNKIHTKLIINSLRSQHSSHSPPLHLPLWC